MTKPGNCCPWRRKSGRGLKLKANSIPDGVLRMLAFTMLEETLDESSVFCIEEPENGIHPDNLARVNGLLRFIAVDPQEAPCVRKTQCGK